MSEQGVIIKGIGGFYYVKTNDGIVHEVKARGRFRKEGIKPLCGDMVEIENGWIDLIHERKNLLIRPPVANLDQLLIVISASLPVPDMVMIDKIILSGRYYGLDIIIAVNKIDDAKKDVNEIVEQYKDANIKTVLLSTYTGEGIDELKSMLKNRITAMAGQSAVGKSSIINKLLPSLNLKVGDIIGKTEKGKQTTRQSELIYIPELNAGIMDTPGFAVYEGIEILPEELSSYYPEFALYGDCRYPSCLHDKESDCAVKEAYKKKLINGRRYNRYLVILEELKQRRIDKYD